MRRASWIALGAALVVGCGGGGAVRDPGTPPPVTPTPPPEGSGRRWSPRVEGLYQALLSDELGTDRVVAMTFGAHGTHLCEAYALVRLPGGGFRAIRAGLRMPDDSPLEWSAVDLPVEEGEALWEQVVALDPGQLEDDASLSRFVRGPGAVRIAYRRGATTHSAEAWAIRALAERKGIVGFRALVGLLQEAVPPAP